MVVRIRPTFRKCVDDIDIGDIDDTVNANKPSFKKLRDLCVSVHRNMELVWRQFLG